MATGMKWVVTVLIGCALVTAWAATIPSPDQVTVAARDELARSLHANMSALSAADAAYREFARADSLLPLLPAAPSAVVSLSPGLAPSHRDSIAAAVARELAALGEPRARIGVFLIDIAYGSRPGIPAVGVPVDLEIYVGTDDAGPYCAVVAGDASSDGSRGMNGFSNRLGAARRRGIRASLLGPCAFIARYGVPGTRISEWLRNDAYGMAEVSGSDVPDHIRNPSQQRRLTIWTRGDVRMRGCIGGREDLCTDVALLPMRERPAVEGAATFNLGSAYMYPYRAYPTMLSDIEESFGPERFARFWTSEQDVQTAFAGAFGVSIGAWVREWGQAVYGVERLGPGVGIVTLLLSALLIAVSAAVASFVAERRRF